MNPYDEAPFSADEIDEQIDFATEQLWSKRPSDIPTPDLRLIEDLQRTYPPNDEEIAQALERVRQRLAQVASPSSEAQSAPWHWQANQPDQEYALVSFPPHMPPGRSQLSSQLRSIPAPFIALVSIVLLVAVIGSLTIGFLLGQQRGPIVPSQATATPQPRSTPMPTPTSQATSVPSPTPTTQAGSAACPTVTPTADASPTTTALASAVTMVEFPIPTAGSGPAAIAAGADGALWFTECQGKQIGRITPAGVVLEYPVRSFGDANPVDIVAGPDGNVWYTQRALSQVGQMKPSGFTTEWPVTGGAFDIAAGPDGNLWFTESTGNKIGKITPALFFAHEYAVPTVNSQPSGITTGPDGNLWFTEYRGNKIGRLNPNGATAEFPLPTANSGPEAITLGPDGNLWFMEANTQKIGRITPAGVITEFQVQGIHSLDNGRITKGRDGNLWFTVPGDDLIGRITPTGSISTFRVPTPEAVPEGIIAGPDGNLWFTEFATNKIGRITLGG
ncbi:MAG TPA: hypothetical protein VKT82_26545 [Ktedonobacterales bacterium]|nr:hypothetical protein [Ktedonobacterales bacterium]